MAKIPFDKLMKSFTLAPGETQPGLSEVNPRYLQEIEARNVIRKEAHLPLLDVAKELAHLEQVARAREIENFVRNSPLRARVQAKCLFLIRKRRESRTGFHAVSCPAAAWPSPLVWTGSCVTFGNMVSGCRRRQINYATRP